MIKRLFVIVSILIIVSSCDYGIASQNDIKKALEQAYFDGQKDALNGDIRIKLNSDSCWIWIKSPWDEGFAPDFNPSFNCEINVD